MDRLREFLEAVKSNDSARGRFRGLIHILVGRRIRATDGELVSNGMTWRDLAALFKRARWDREFVRELGIDPADLPPRDREKFWYVAITKAGVLSPESIADAETFIPVLQALGYEIGSLPGT